MRGLIAVLAVMAALPAQAAAGPQKRLDSARGRWADLGTRDYHFKLEILRFRTQHDPYALKVRNGRAVDPPEEVGRVTTVPRLFRVIQNALDDHYADVEVTYGKHGLPRRVFLDQSDEIVDEETTYLASSLRVD
jgi:hypothetical protein